MQWRFLPETLFPDPTSYVACFVELESSLDVWVGLRHGVKCQQMLSVMHIPIAFSAVTWLRFSAVVVFLICFAERECRRGFGESCLGT